MKTIYLIPSTLAPETAQQVLPQEVKDAVLNTTHFFVEDIRSARRFISSLRLGINIPDLLFWEVNKNTDDKQLTFIFNEAKKAKTIGVISEAGCPGIADPGSKVVAYAHRKGWKVDPLVGPSSILLALISSGFNGQSFTFHGYLPIKKVEKLKRINELETLVLQTGSTQIFMETPFRNQAMMEDLIRGLNNQTKLCVAANLTSEEQFIKTMTVHEWKNNMPEIGKIPAIFLIGN